MALQEGNIETLAKLMQAKKKEGEEPFVLVLGAGASLSSGSPGMDEIIARIQEASGCDLSALSEEEIKAEFYNFLDNLTADNRYLLLRDSFEKARPSVGYLKLAELAKGGYFKYILTTNYDWLLEDAFREAGMTVNRDYAVFVVEKDEESQILRQLRFPRPPVKVLKLHGDLSARIFKFTLDEIFQFPEKLEKKVTELLSRAFIVVGHSMRDTDLNRCIHREGGAIWYVNPEAPKVNTLIWQAINVRGGSRCIRGDDGTFDIFFAKLYSQLYEIPILSRKEVERLEIPKHVERTQALARELLEEGEKIRCRHIKHLLKLLDERYDRLHELQKQKLTASASERLRLLSQIKEEKEEIEKLKDQLAESGYIPPL